MVPRGFFLWSTLMRMDPKLKRDTHGEKACYNAGCRCVLCTKAASTYQKEWVKRHPDAESARKKRGRQLKREYGPHLGLPIKHGTFNSYLHRGCRCDLCRAANNEVVQRGKARRVAKGGLIPHGLQGYGNYKCRCEICKAAKAEYNQEARLRRAERIQNLPEGEPLPGGHHHGTCSAYAYGCRCDTCRAAAVECEFRRRKNKAETVPSRHDEPASP